MKGVPGFALGFVKDNISEVTERALQQIGQEAAQSIASTTQLASENYTIINSQNKVITSLKLWSN